MGRGSQRGDNRLTVRIDKHLAACWKAFHVSPLFVPLCDHARVRLMVKGDPRGSAEGGWERTCTFRIELSDEPDQVAWLIAHHLLHLAFGHHQKRPDAHAWHTACDLVAARFLHQVRFGRRLFGPSVNLFSYPADEETAYELFRLKGVAEELTAGGFGQGPLCPEEEDPVWHRGYHEPTDWPALLAEGVRDALRDAVAYAGGELRSPDSPRRARTAAEIAREWFVCTYPLLGALAADFHLIEDTAVCQRASISVAAVCPEAREIYINPGRRLSDAECRFVIAHELLHVGLCHHSRSRGRHALIWNFACDYVVNGWLVEMDIGAMPPDALYEPGFAGLSAEEVYDRIVCDMRRCRRLATLRGVGVGDILTHRPEDWWRTPAGVDLDELWRRCLCQGLRCHEERGRGFLPAGLVETIRALEQPPVPWDVELAQWFDAQFPPLERRRTYARPSRRQGATPDIPRPRYVAPDETPSRVFGLLLDTSGSMHRVTLGQGLGATVSYALARDVAAVRVVFCDARAYDQGYLAPEAIAGRVEVTGRGGTVLQPALDLLDRALDFPAAAPVLIVTDGCCDRLRVTRSHAYLMPAGATLPHPPAGPVFRISE